MKDSCNVYFVATLSKQKFSFWSFSSVQSGACGFYFLQITILTKSRHKNFIEKASKMPKKPQTADVEIRC